MLTDPLAIRHYQKLTDGMVDLWHRGGRYEDLRMYMEGYLACLRHANVMENYLVNRIEEEAWRFLRDASNFETPVPQMQTQTEADYY